MGQTTRPDQFVLSHWYIVRIGGGKVVLQESDQHKQKAIGIAVPTKPKADGCRYCRNVLEALELVLPLAREA